jgi:hypothetical protein
MYLGLALVVNTIIFALSLSMLIPQGMWIWLAGLVFSTALITLILPEVKHKND